MINAFPEIERFFNQDSFTEEELLKFKEIIECSYNEKSIRSKAITLIDLKLLSFQLKSNDVGNRKTVKVKRKQKKKRSKRIYETHTIQSDKIELEHHEFIGLSLKDLSEKIEMIPRIMLKKMEEVFGNRYDLNYILLKRDIDKLDGFLKQRLRLIKPEKINQKEVKNYSRPKKTRSGGSSGVYAELQKYGVGKLIYIRKS